MMSNAEGFPLDRVFRSAYDTSDRHKCFRIAIFILGIFMASTGTDSLYTIIKGRFKAIDTNTFGLILIFINNNLKVAENISVIASHFSSLYETDPKGSWADMEERIFSLKWKGEFATSISRDIQSYIESTLKDDRTEEMYNFIKQNAVSKIENTFFSMLMKPLGEKNIHIELSWEKVSGEEIQQAKEARENREAEETGPQEEVQSSEDAALSEEFNLEEGSVVLDVNLILAPVSGIPIFELKKGDRIMVKIDASTNKGKYFIDLLNATHDGDVVPIPAQVYGVKVNKFNEFSIVLKIGEGIFGKVIETEPVKLKKYDPDSDKSRAQATQKNLQSAGFGPTPRQGSKEDKAINNLYWLMYLGGFVVVAAILLIIMQLV